MERKKISMTLEDKCMMNLLSKSAKVKPIRKSRWYYETSLKMFMIKHLSSQFIMKFVVQSSKMVSVQMVVSYTVGEPGRIGSPGRREIGHGYLAERALLPVLPSEEDFPYAIRSVTEIMSQNGSTSMAATCSSCMALMDAGVPLKRPVSGVAMGLMVDVPKGQPIEASDIDKAYVLTDLMDAEDFAGDMDFKVTGTTEGVTALQMDMKVHGLPVEIMEKAIKQSHEGRMFILKHMLSVIPEPRDEISKYAPRIEKLMINPDKIGAVIGKGGETINKITSETGAEVNIDDEGLVTISGKDPEKIEKALEWIKGLD